MNHAKMLFTADLHGNELQYTKLVDFARDISADFVVIGGDLAPKNIVKNAFIEIQRMFISDRLPKLLQPLKDAKIKAYLMMGNDDVAANYDVFEHYDGNFYNIIHNRRLPLKEGFEILGYSYVPITPFSIKDWEKFDLSDVPPELAEDYFQRKRNNYSLKGCKTIGGTWTTATFTHGVEKRDSIQKDLETELFRERAGKTIYAIHTPPNNTNLDQVASGNHVGSFALRMFIEKYQPHLMLHGHTHETVDVSGEFKDIIGRTLCMSAGNHNEGSSLAVLVFDLHKPEEARRMII